MPYPLWWRPAEVTHKGERWRLVETHNDKIQTYYKVSMLDKPYTVRVMLDYEESMRLSTKDLYLTLLRRAEQLKGEN